MLQYYIFNILRKKSFKREKIIGLLERIVYHFYVMFAVESRTMVVHLEKFSYLINTERVGIDDDGRLIIWHEIIRLFKSK